MDFGPDAARIAEWQYQRVKVALLTGWTLDYIDGLGLVDSDAVLQVAEADAMLRQPKRKK